MPGGKGQVCWVSFQVERLTYLQGPLTFTWDSTRTKYQLFNPAMRYLFSQRLFVLLWEAIATFSFSSQFFAIRKTRSVYTVKLVSTCTAAAWRHLGSERVCNCKKIPQSHFPALRIWTKALCFIPCTAAWLLSIANFKERQSISTLCWTSFGSAGRRETKGEKRRNY